MTRRLLTLFIAFTVAACGQVPLPFHESPKLLSGSPLLDMPTALGIAVLPVNGVPQPLASQISTAVAEQFGVLEVPAEAVDVNRGLGFSLQGDAQEIETTPAGVSVAITWRLQSRHSEVAADYRQTATIPPAAWRDGDQIVATRLAAEAAGRLTTIIAGDAPVPASPAQADAPAQYPTVSTKPVEGAPGDGRDSLRLAVLGALSQNGVRRDDVNPDIVLNCTVTSERFNDDLQHIEIVWSAVGRDGVEVGTVKLENTIPGGALDGAWGPTAFVIADAAVADLLQLLSAVPPDSVANPQQAPR